MRGTRDLEETEIFLLSFSWSFMWLVFFAEEEHETLVLNRGKIEIKFYFQVSDTTGHWFFDWLGVPGSDLEDQWLPR